MGGLQEESKSGWLLCHKKHMLLAFSSSRRGDASPSTALQTVWHTGHGRKPLERSQPPPASSMERVSVYSVRVRVCMRPYVAAHDSQMLHCACSIIGGFSPHTMSEICNMTAVQRNPEKQRVIILFIPQRWAKNTCTILTISTDMSQCIIKGTLYESPLNIQR